MGAMAKNKAAVALGRKGGKARVPKGVMAAMTPDERSAYARKMLKAKELKKSANFTPNFTPKT